MRRFLILASVFMSCAISANAEVYAVVNGEEITDKDMLFLKQAMPQANLEALPKEIKDRAVEQAIDFKLLTQEAKKSKVEDSKEYKEALEVLKGQLMLDIWSAKEREKIKVSESKIKQFYNENKDKLVVPEMANARHILVKTKNEANAIITELNKAGSKAEEKFIELAKAKSIDPSAQNGGALGEFPRDQMVPEFSKAAFGLKNGTYTKTPVQTQFGFHVIYLIDKKKQSLVKYEDAKPMIEETIRTNEAREAIMKKASDLKKKAKIERK